MTKDPTQFLESIGVGKWFVVKGKYGGNYAVKMIKSKAYNKGIHSVWLSANDPESMAIEDYLKGDWKYEDSKFERQGAGVYHFGSFEIEEDSIYDEQGKVVLDKMVEEIIQNCEPGFVTEQEIVDTWNMLADDKLTFEVLECK
ncbi:hypothetical protein [Paenibacillus sp. FSL H3-0333]|uniref:hypothetical protein n=1 Tax=Paenibacillus sp. FSL H3-0333 TaxID=2921373 RepID=UPI0030F8CD32